MHTQQTGSFALIAIGVLHDSKDEFLFEFADGFRIGNAAAIHVHNQSFQLIFHDALSANVCPVVPQVMVCRRCCCPPLKHARERCAATSSRPKSAAATPPAPPRSRLGW